MTLNLIRRSRRCLTPQEQLDAELDALELPPISVADTEILNPRYVPVVFDYLGQQRWELIEAGVFTQGTFIFKRPCDTPHA